MSTFTKSLALLVAAAFTLSFTSTASAVNWTPTAAGTYDWDNNGNWDAAFPDAASADANVSLNISGNQAIDLNANRTVGTMSIGDTDSTNNFTINGGASLVFDNGGSNATLTKVANTSTAIDLISSGITLNDNLEITNNSALYISGAGPYGMLRLAGGIVDGSSGSKGITKLGTGTVSVFGGTANTYTGATVVNNGTLLIQAANSIPDASAVSVIATGAGNTAVLRWGLFNGGVPETIGPLTLGGTTTTSQAIVNMGYLQNLTLGGDVTYDATNNPLGGIMGFSSMSLGRITLGGATRTFNVGDSSSAAADLSINQLIINGSMIKDGLGRLDFGTGGNTLTNIWVKRGAAFAYQPNGMSASVTIGDSSGSDDVQVHMERGGNTNVIVSGGNTGNALLTGRWGVGSGSTAMSGTIQLGNGFGAHDLTIGVAGSNNFPTYTGDISGNGDLTLDSTGANQLRMWQSSIDHAGSIIATGTATVDVTASIGPNVTAVNKTGNGTLNLSGVNTYVGDTTVSAGTFNFNDNAGLLFDIDASGINNSILGVGTANLNGDFTFDLSGAGMSLGDTWNIVDVASLNETFGATFTVNGFADIGGDQWEFMTGPTTYTFSESTGLLVVTAAASSPEPSALVLAVLGLVGVCCTRRRRKRSV